MQLDDLKKTWKEEIDMKTDVFDFERVRKKVDRFDRRARFAWALEVIACAAVIAIAVLMWMGGDAPNLLLQLGMIAMIGCALFIGGKIILDRKVSTQDDWTLMARLNIQIEKREKEIKLLGSVASWYLTPLLVAIFLCSYGGYAHRTGTYIPDAGLWIYWALCAVLYVIIYFYNQYQVKKRVQPVLDQLYKLRSELQT